MDDSRGSVFHRSVDSLALYWAPGFLISVSDPVLVREINYWMSE